ncbi:unnamed protein product [Colias eurytheme]|nr:unnamed protein product [Colias eurytheme]
MSGEDYALIALAETTKDCVKPFKAEKFTLLEPKPKRRRNERSRSFFWKLPTIRLVPSMSQVRHRLRKLSCVSNDEDEEQMIPADMPRHKSIDIGVGLARRMSLFIFTRRSVCVHPYHPFTPKQTTRKIYLRCDDKK